MDALMNRKEQFTADIKGKWTRRKCAIVQPLSGFNPQRNIDVLSRLTAFIVLLKRSNSMSHFSMCPTERVLDTAKSPDPGAACPDRAQRARWERQSQSVVTDGSHRSITTRTNVCRLNLDRTRDRGAVETSICCSTVRLKAQYFT